MSPHALPIRATRLWIGVFAAILCSSCGTDLRRDSEGRLTDPAVVRQAVEVALGAWHDAPDLAATSKPSPGGRLRRPAKAPLAPPHIYHPGRFRVRGLSQVPGQTVPRRAGGVETRRLLRLRSGAHLGLSQRRFRYDHALGVPTAGRSAPGTRPIDLQGLSRIESRWP